MEADFASQKQGINVVVKGTHAGLSSNPSKVRICVPKLAYGITNEENQATCNTSGVTYLLRALQLSGNLQATTF